MLVLFLWSKDELKQSVLLADQKHCVVISDLYGENVNLYF